MFPDNAGATIGLKAFDKCSENHPGNCTNETFSFSIDVRYILDEAQWFTNSSVVW